MGLKKIDMRKMIRDQKRRTNSFYKRMYGIVRKLIQMSQLCNSHIIFYMYNEDLKQLYEYESNKKFNLRTLEAMIHSTKKAANNDPEIPTQNLQKEFPVIRMTKYDKSDYETLTHKHLPRQQHEGKLKQLYGKMEGKQDSDGERDQEIEEFMDIVSEEEIEQREPGQDQVTQKNSIPQLFNNQEYFTEEVDSQSSTLYNEKPKIKEQVNKLGSMNMKNSGYNLSQILEIQTHLDGKKGHRPDQIDEGNYYVYHQPEAKRQKLDHAEQLKHEHPMAQNPAPDIESQAEGKMQFHDGFQFDFKKYRDKIRINIIDYKNKV